MNWVKKFLSLFYKDKNTKITYSFIPNEKDAILARFLIYERNIVDMDVYDVVNFGEEGPNVFAFIIKPKEIPPPPPPPPIPTPPKNENIVNNEDNTPHRANS